MAKGSVRKKGKKWYYRFYIEDESGNRVQKEYPGTESKSETEALLRKAMENYETTLFIAKAKNVTVGALLDCWLEEEISGSSRASGTVHDYANIVSIIKRHPIGKRKLQTVKPEHLQKFFDELCSGKSYGRIYSFAAVLRGAFRFAVFPKQYIVFNPMQYITLRTTKNNSDELFQTDDENLKTVTVEQFKIIVNHLKASGSEYLLPIQIAYYSGLRLGEACALSWQDIDLDEQCMTVRRSMSQYQLNKSVEIGPTKRSKVRRVEFGDTLAEILRSSLAEQENNRKKYGEFYMRNYCIAVKEKNRIRYELFAKDGTQELPEEHILCDLVCVRQDGQFIRKQSLTATCRNMSRQIPELEGFHFHALRHTFTSNLIAKGAAPKDVQEMLGHSDVNLTLNVYTHSDRESKRKSAKLLDTLVAE